MATFDSVLTKMRNLISKVNTKTGRSDSDLTSAVDVLIDGYLPNGIVPSGTKTITINGTHDVKNYESAEVNVQTGITPSGTKTITANGDYDVTEFATASVNVPASGITPSGTTTITTNGTHDVTSFASALVNVPAGITPSGTTTITENGTYDVTSYATAEVNVPGLKAQLYTITVDADKTSTVYLVQDDYLTSLRDNPNAFLCMRAMNPQASTAMVHFWFTSNFTMYYSGSTAYNSVIARATASAVNLNGNKNGLVGDNYNAHLNVDTSGRVWAIPNATYPIKAGTYQLIAGTFEML